MPKRSSLVGRLYMDALGEPGRSQGSRPAYAICTIWTPHTEDELESIFVSVRQSLKLRVGYEFHARQLTKRDWTAQLPERFFQLLMDHGLQVECWCAEVQKSRSRLPIHIAGKALTHELVAQTLARMPREKVEGLTLTMDEKTSGKKVSKVIEEMRTSVRTALRAQGRDYMLGKISARPAHQKTGLQLADFLAAAIVEPWPACAKLLKGWPIHQWRT